MQNNSLFHSTVCYLYAYFVKDCNYFLCDLYKHEMNMYISFSSEILQEERSNALDAMRRENRRVAAASWGEQPPPKPSRPNTNLTGQYLPDRTTYL